MRSALITITLMALSLSTERLPAQEKQISGYITRVISPTDIEVNGTPIRITSQTSITFANNKQTSVPPKPFLGESAQIAGSVLLQTGVLQAQSIILTPPAERTVRGVAIIEQVSRTPSGSPLIFADGRKLELPTTLSFTTKAKSMPVSGIHPNIWIVYTGEQHEDGLVTVTAAEFSDNTVDKAEANFLASQEPVSGQTHKSSFDKALHASDPKRVINYADPVMQARLTRIGQSLIPEYQKALPSTDPTRINFHFQLVDEPGWPDAWPKASGYILIPRQIVARLPNDSELATILAENMTIILEKHAYRQVQLEAKLFPANVGGLITGIFLPSAGLATEIATTIREQSSLKAMRQQSDRISLQLLHNAGYDITLAPEAWWTLAAKPGHDPHLKNPPPRAANLFDTLGTTWRTTLAPAAQQASANLP